MNFYLISPQVHHGQSTEHFVDIMFQQNIVMMGWEPEKPIGSDFSTKIEIGDFVLVAQRVNWKFNYYFAGTVCSDSFKDENGDQCRKLNPFIDLRNSKIDYLEGASFAKMNQLKALVAINPNKNESVIRRLEEILNNYSNRTQMENYIKLLLSKKNIILQGAPGTGKTFTTASIAVRMCNKEFTDYDDHKKVMDEYERLRKLGQISFCTFHQSMDYEDFVEGLKPIANETSVEYNVENGIFKNICEKAQTREDADILTCIDKYLQSIKGYANRKTIPTLSGKSNLLVWWNEGNDTISARSVLSKSDRGEEHSVSPLNIEKVKMLATGEDVETINWRRYCQAFINAVKTEYQLDKQVSNKPYILIIDEINRGNVSKIFGELITLLEADKRIGEGNHSLTLKLPYSKEDFGVPSNLYIIGTMNTTDRSTGTIDYAVRRRFAFVTLEASSEVLEEWCENNSVNEDVKQASLALFAEINGATRDDTNSFIAKHKAADFELEDLKVGHSYFMAKDLDTLKLKMRYEVVPLIKEYQKDGILKTEKDDHLYFEKWVEAECKTQSTQQSSDE